MIPAVTNHDDADITELEAFRVATNKENEKSGVKVTMLAFLIKACVAALKKFPEFNSSLDGDALVYKQYFHIGFAADTPNGLVVPVIKDADKKGILQISQEMGELAKKARDGKLTRPRCPAPASPSPAWAALAGATSRPSSMRPKSPSWACARARWSRCGTARPLCRA
jgi:pyruvate/2-oxoglutarate dehydrogenase complex dihydrolipoamide acyltransferase (E2) component